jgi:signal transduction histidine kinase
MITEATAVFKLSYPNISIQYSSVDPTLTIYVDPRQMGQVFNNLIINAIDAMNSSGTITIGATVITKREQNFCRLIFRDTCTGIPPENITQLFNPYFTTKDHGTGLGLSILSV